MKLMPILRLSVPRGDGTESRREPAQARLRSPSPIAVEPGVGHFGQVSHDRRIAIDPPPPPPSPRLLAIGGGLFYVFAQVARGRTPEHPAVACTYLGLRDSPASVLINSHGFILPPFPPPRTAAAAAPAIRSTLVFRWEPL